MNVFLFYLIYISIIAGLILNYSFHSIYTLIRMLDYEFLDKRDHF